MRAQSTQPVLSLVLGAVLLCAPAAYLAAGEPKAEPDSELVERIETQLESVESRMISLQEQEFTLTMQIMQAQQKAQQGLKEPGKAAEQLANGERGKALLEYKAVMISWAGQLQAFDGRLFPLQKTVAGLQRDRDKAPEVLRARIDAVAGRVEGKHRTNLEKIANMYEQVAEWRGALGIYLKMYKDIPEARRKTDWGMITKLADLYEKLGDNRNALLLYKGVLDAKKEKERFNDKNLCDKIGGLYSKMGDYRSALAIYKGHFETIPKKGRYNDRDIGGKLADLYVKTGDPRTALTLYRSLYDAIPQDKKDSDGKDIHGKIKEIERRGSKKKR